MKKFALMFAMLIGLVGNAFATEDVWSTATAAATSAVSSVGALLIILVGIPVAFLAYRVVKRGLRG
jgi:hypothetical protein